MSHIKKLLLQASYMKSHGDVVSDIILSYCCALALCVNKTVAYTSLANLCDIFSTDLLYGIFAFSISFLILRKSRQKQSLGEYVLTKRTFTAVLVASLCLAMSWVFGINISYHESILRGNATLLSVFGTSITLLLSWVCFYTYAKCVYLHIAEFSFSYTAHSNSNKTMFIKLFLFFWIPRLGFFLLYWPGLLTWDSISNLYESIGWIALRNAHPPLYIKVLSVFSNFGMNYLNGLGQGLGLFNLCGLTFTSIALAIFFTFFWRFSMPTILKRGLLLYCAIHPLFIHYSFHLCKDIYLNDFLLLFVLVVIYMSFSTCKQNKSWALNLFFILSACGVYVLHRKAVIYIIAAFLGLLLSGVLSKKRLLSLVAITACSILIINIAISSLLQPKPFRLPDQYALVHQQLAFVMKKHPEAFSAEEAKIYDAVYDFEWVRDRMEAWEVDPVKDRMNIDNWEKYRIDLLKIWLKKGFSHPITYLDTLGNLSVAYWHPYKKPVAYPVGNYYELQYGGNVNWYADTIGIVPDPRYAKACGYDIDLSKRIPNAEYQTFDEGYDFNYHPDESRWLRRFKLFLIYHLSYYPIVTLFYLPGITMWLYIFSTMCAFIKRNRRAVALLCIGASVILSCVLSPVNNYTRYAYNMLMILPVILPFCWCRIDTNNTVDQAKH